MGGAAALLVVVLLMMIVVASVHMHVAHAVLMRVTNVTVYDQSTTDLTLQYNDQITILVGFDSVFDDSIFASCPPILTLNAASSAAAVRWIPRANISSSYGFSHVHNVFSSEDPAQLKPPPNNTLAFHYVVAKGDWANALDIGSAKVPKSSALSYRCSAELDAEADPSAQTDATVLDLLPLSYLSITPVYSVSSRVPYPIQAKSRQKSGTFNIGDQIDIIIEYDASIQAVTAAASYLPSVDQGARVQLHSTEDGIMGYYPMQVPASASQSGLPTYIMLNNNASAYFVGFDGNDTNSLVFRYIVGEGDGSEALDINWAHTPGGIVMGSTILSSAQSGIRLDDAEIYGTAQLSLRLTTVSQLKISAAGQKFPPLGYDPEAVPFRNGASRRTNKRRQTALPPNEPVEIQVMIDFQSLWSVSEKAQTFSADIVRLQKWYDSRFDSPNLPMRYDLAFSELSKIWYPKLTFHNTREFLKPMDFVCAVFNNGTVVLQERFIHTFFSRLNVRKFPFDTQSFGVSVRSVNFNRDYVRLVPATDMPSDFVPPSDGVWNFLSLKQEVDTNRYGLYQNYDILRTVVQARRISTYNVIQIFFPLTVICLAQLLTYFFPIKSDARMSVCLSGMVATITFNFVVGNSSPPVNYMTRMTLFSVVTLIFCVITLVIQTFIRTVMFAVELIKKERDKEKKLKDAVPVSGQLEMQDMSAKRAQELVDPLLPMDNNGKASSSGHSGDKVDELTDCVLFFGLIVITMQNRVMWMRRLTRINDIIRIVFAVSLVVTITIIISY